MTSSVPQLIFFGMSLDYLLYLWQSGMRELREEMMLDLVVEPSDEVSPEARFGVEIGRVDNLKSPPVDFGNALVVDDASFRSPVVDREE